MNLLHFLDPLFGWQGPFVAALVFIPLERLLPLHRKSILPRDWKTEGLYIFFNSLLFRFVFIMAAVVLISATALHPFSWSSGFLAKLPFPLEVAGAVIVGDFSLYWAHRALHKNKTLWRFHAIHHAVDEIDWTVAYHNHVVDDLVLSGAAFGSVALLGFPSAAIAVYGVVYSWVSFAVHANTSATTGPLRRLLSSPEFHHWHHSNEAEARDRNFAAIISLWDFAFGTGFLPSARKPEIYGADDNIPDSYVDQLLYPFRPGRPSPQTAGVSTMNEGA